MTNDFTLLVSDIADMRALAQGQFLFMVLILGSLFFFAYRSGRLGLVIACFCLGLVGRAGATSSFTVTAVFTCGAGAGRGFSVQDSRGISGCYSDAYGYSGEGCAAGPVGYGYCDPASFYYTVCGSTNRYILTGDTSGGVGASFALGLAYVPPPLVTNSYSASVFVTNTTSGAMTYQLGRLGASGTNLSVASFILLPGAVQSISLTDSNAFTYAVLGRALGDDSAPLVGVSSGQGVGASVTNAVPVLSSIGSAVAAANTSGVTQGSMAQAQQTALAAGTENLDALVGAIKAGPTNAGGGDSALDAWATNAGTATFSGSVGFTNEAVPYSLTLPTIGSTLPSVAIPMSDLNSYLPAGLAFADLTLDFTTQSFWASLISGFRGLLLVLMTIEFVLMYLRLLWSMGAK